MSSIISMDTFNFELAKDKRIVNSAVDNHISDMVKHFNGLPSGINSEGDERYVYNKRNLVQILAGLNNPDSVKVTALYDKGEFYCWRLDRITS